MNIPKKSNQISRRKAILSVGLLAALTPLVKFNFSKGLFKKESVSKKNIKVNIHPLAVKRNNKEKMNEA